MTFLSVQTATDEANEKTNKQLWNLNYESSHGSEDIDAYDLEESEQEAAEATQVSDKILNGEPIEELKQVIVESTRLRDVYNNRWWNPNLDGCYFAMFNYKATKIQKGEELLFSYGMRGNSYLIEK